MKMKRAGFLTKLVVLALLIYMATSLLGLRSQLQSYREKQAALAGQVARMKQENAQLADAIENKDDPDVLESVARDKGYVKAGERLFIDVAN